MSPLRNHLRGCVKFYANFIHKNFAKGSRFQRLKKILEFLALEGTYIFIHICTYKLMYVYKNLTKQTLEPHEKINAFQIRKKI